MKISNMLVVFLALVTPEIGFAETDEYIKLYQNPERFRGQIVELVGRLDLHFEGDTVRSEDHWTEGYCIVLKLDQRDQYQYLNGRKVRVSGEFQPEELDFKSPRRERGRMIIQLGPYCHTLKNITKMVEA